jgi:hypothetical protein
MAKEEIAARLNGNGSSHWKAATHDDLEAQTILSLDDTPHLEGLLA